MTERKQYLVTKRKLTYPSLQHPQNKGQPYSRPVLESGEAVKNVYLSKAPPSFGNDELEKALNDHIRRMRKEMHRDGKQITKITKVLWGEGDVRLIATWQVLGAKRTKKYRKLHASNVGDRPGGAGE